MKKENQNFDEWDNIFNQKNTDKFDKNEWDKVINDKNEMKNPVENENLVSNEAVVVRSNNSSVTTSKKNIYITIGVAVLLFVFIIPLFFGGSSTLSSGDGYKVKGSVKISGNTATMTGTIKVSKSGMYKVNVSIYNSNGGYLGSNSDTFILTAGDSASVYIYVPNIMGGATPSKYSVTVSKY